jgi:uncharacterized protein YcfJ
MELFRSILFIFLAVTSSSCATNTGTGILAGGVIGTSAGALAGKSQGAWIGAAVGVVTGGLIGYAMDVQDRNAMEKSSPRTVDRMDRGEPLTINDVIKLTQGAVGDEEIIRYMQDTHSTYNLSQAQIRRLQDAGVSQTVINYMIDSGR